MATGNSATLSLNNTSGTAEDRAAGISAANGIPPGLASTALTVNNNGVDSNSLKENDIARNAIADSQVRRIHKTAAVFDGEYTVAEALDIGKCFQQNIGFLDEVFHQE